MSFHNIDIIGGEDTTIKDTVQTRLDSRQSGQIGLFNYTATVVPQLQCIC